MTAEKSQSLDYRHDGENYAHRRRSAGIYFSDKKSIGHIIKGSYQHAYNSWNRQTSDKLGDGSFRHHLIFLIL